MAWPQNLRRSSIRQQRVIVRRLRALKRAVVSFEVRPRWGFEVQNEEIRAKRGGVAFQFAAGQLAVWTSFPVRIESNAAVADLSITTGEELWAVIGWNIQPDDWTRQRAAKVFDAGLRYWRGWSAGLKIDAADSRATTLQRSAIAVHLLTHAKNNSAVAALTTSLPERIGGRSQLRLSFRLGARRLLVTGPAGAPR
jgi:GH15 family glucan-1,4-alpha-glucosidase